MLGRQGTDLGISFLVLPFFRAMTLDKSPHLPEPQLPHMDAGYANTCVTGLLCC